MEPGLIDVSVYVRLSDGSASDAMTVIKIVPTTVSSFTEEVAGKDENAGLFPK